MGKTNSRKQIGVKTYFVVLVLHRNHKSLQKSEAAKALSNLSFRN